LKIIFELLINEITIIFDQTFSFLISLCLNTVFVHHKNKNKFILLLDLISLAKQVFNIKYECI
jgi:hypothetical protein